jgi:hypothetical protein
MPLPSSAVVWRYQNRFSLLATARLVIHSGGAGKAYLAERALDAFYK